MGYVKLDRKILDWEWWSDVNTYRVFTYCLIRANWKESRFKGVEVPRGAFITSLKSLSKATNLSIQQVRTALDHLKSTGEVTINSHAKFSVVIVNNYIQYQDDNTIDNTQVTSKQHDSNTIATTEEEYKNIKNNKKENVRDYFSKDEILKSAFKDFSEMRTRIKKPLTDRAVTMLITALEKISTDPYVQADLLDQSTFHGWQSVFPLKKDFVSSREKPQEKKETKKIIPIKRDEVVDLEPDESNSLEWEEDRKKHPFDEGWRIDNDGYWVKENV